MSERSRRPNVTIAGADWLYLDMIVSKWILLYFIGSHWCAFSLGFNRNHHHIHIYSSRDQPPHIQPTKHFEVRASRGVRGPPTLASLGHSSGYSPVCDFLKR